LKRVKRKAVTFLQLLEIQLFNLWSGWD